MLPISPCFRCNIRIFNIHKTKYGPNEQADRYRTPKSLRSEESKDISWLLDATCFMSILIAVTPQNCSILILSRIKVVILLLIYLESFIYLIPLSLAPPFLCLVLLNSNIANTIDTTAIKATVRKVRPYDSGDGNVAETLFISDSIII
jgi:hypothetical protein